MKVQALTRLLKSRAHWALLAVAVLVLVAGGTAAFAILHKPKFTVPVASLSHGQFNTEVAHLTYLMKKNGAKASFDYVENKITTDPSFAKDCHPLLHELGHAAYEYYGGYAQAIKYQNELCDSGYTHGVLEEYLSNTPNIGDVLQTACSSETQMFDQWQCYHGLGHGVMLASAGDVGKSIGLCNSLPTAFSQGACVNGIFMQHFVVTHHDGSVPVSNPTSLNDCTAQPAPYKTDCYHYAPTAYLTEHSAQYAAAMTWCGGAELQYVTTCIDGVGAEAMKDNIQNVDVAKKVCDSLSKTSADACVTGAVNMYVFFHASSSSAEPLCRNQFKGYKATCGKAIADAHNSLKI